MIALGTISELFYLKKKKEQQRYYYYQIYVLEMFLLQYSLKV